MLSRLVELDVVDGIGWGGVREGFSVMLGRGYCYLVFVRFWIYFRFDSLI